MPKKPFSYHIGSIELSTHVHATEDVQKVKEAFLFLLPENLHDEIKVDVNEVRGHWDNIITTLQTKLTDADTAMEIITYLINFLSEQEKQTLKRDLDKRIDESHLYLRFDKQAAFKRRLKIEEENDVIRIIIKFIIYPSPTREKVKSICESLLKP